MNDDLRVVFESGNRAECSDRALVLASLQIPYQIISDEDSCALIVPAEFSAQAMDQLIQYDDENPPLVVPKTVAIQYQDAVPGLIAYALIIVGVTVLAGFAASNSEWIAAGRIDGALVRAGEWWRAITALTLHSGLRHIVGNLVFGALFGLFAGRLLGPGVAWLVILLAGASGNVLNTLLLDSAHRALGASTAVFAALGLVAGYVWRGKLMAQDRWAYRVGPVVGGFALLMYTGTGGENTDVGAHLMGFLCGFGSGILLSPMRTRLVNAKLQLVCGFAAIAIISGAWIVALQS
jgi:membrane associated rhomboid family serine protease